MGCRKGNEFFVVERLRGSAFSLLQRVAARLDGAARVDHLAAQPPPARLEDLAARARQVTRAPPQSIATAASLLRDRRTHLPSIVIPALSTHRHGHIAASDVPPAPARRAAISLPRCLS